MSDHVRNIINSSAQTLHALRVLRSHGMCTAAIHEVFRAVIMAKLCYAGSAWWRFTSADDRQRLNAFIRRSIKQGFCSADATDLAAAIDTADESLFKRTCNDVHHVLHKLLPDVVDRPYYLRSRQHDRQLITKPTRLFECNFIVHMLYKDIY